MGAGSGESEVPEDLPEWAVPFWEDLGRPNIDGFRDVYSGPLLERRTGLRRDDIVEIMLNNRIIPDEMDPWIRGRMLGVYKNIIEILSEDGRFHRISRGAVIQIVLVAHMRAAYIDDEDLLQYERDDQKRRNSLHEEVDKKSSGDDDSHVWG